VARALLDIDCVAFNGEPDKNVFARHLGRSFTALRVFGLQVVGSAPSPAEWECGAPRVRLIVEECPGFSVLPPECSEGWRIVTVTFMQEVVGDQHLVRVAGVSVVGKPRLSLAA
jgi:hypothetical protein